MNIQSVRFGSMELSEDDIITFPQGIVGFRNEREFVLLKRAERSPVGWLQSISNPAFSIPVVSVESLARAIPVDEVADAVTAAGLDATLDACAVMAVLCVPPAAGAATVNLLAPIIVNAQTRQAAQVVLEGSSFTTREPLLLIKAEPESMPMDIRREALEPRAVATSP